MTTDIDVPTLAVAVLGPSRVGKTSLVTALKVAADMQFRGSQISVSPADAGTRAAFRVNNNTMIGELRSGNFSPKLEGTRDIKEYDLRIQIPEVDRDRRLRFFDHPGGFIYDQTGKVKEFLSRSSIVILPIDATLLMESSAEHGAHVAASLEINDLTELIKDWAKEMKANPVDPLLILAPVKCESYFSDNGGQRDDAERLFGKVKEWYEPIVSTFLDEVDVGKARVLYAPVDTIGPIELVDVRWEEVDNSTGWRMIPTYRVRRDATGTTLQRNVVGAKPIWARLVGELIQQEHEFLRDSGEQLRRNRMKVMREQDEKNRHWWQTVIGNVSGSNRERQEAIDKLSAEFDQFSRQIGQLSGARDDLQGDRTRVRTWT